MAYGSSSRENCPVEGAGRGLASRGAGGGAPCDFFGPLHAADPSAKQAAPANIPVIASLLPGFSEDAFNSSRVSPTHLLFDVFMAAPFNAHHHRLSFLFSSVPVVNSPFSEKNGRIRGCSKESSHGHPPMRSGCKADRWTRTRIGLPLNRVLDFCHFSYYQIRHYLVLLIIPNQQSAGVELGIITLKKPFYRRLIKLMVM